MSSMKRYALCATILVTTMFGALATNCYAMDVKSAQTALNDTGITAAINAKYTKCKILNPFDIDVTTKDGVVMLSGEVDTKLQYEQAVMIAESMYDVNTVNADELLVKNSKSPLKDSYITGKIKGKILKAKVLGDNKFSDYDVSVETTDGKVVLKGTVNSNAQVEKILSLVKSTEGVKSVQSSLKVKQNN